MHPMFRNVFLSAAIAASAFLVGCAGPAPNYAPSIDNVETLKKAGNGPVKVGAIGVTPGMAGANSISLRANSMVSPIGSHYGDYLAAALRQELELAKLHNPQSGVEITGTLLKNNIDAGGLSTNAGQIEARFVVKTNGQLRFDKVKRIDHQWESAFAGAVAIPLAANNYPVMVQKLVGSFVSDPDFVKAIRN
ncbi:MAG TPA: hypothetical protein VLJ57_22370 [Burkholderiaceae bacterium]|nr:hypothetical protein [Burkholderiaceae bacterium]